MATYLAANSFLDLNYNAIQVPGEPSAPAALGVLPFGQRRIALGAGARSR